jgi:hypothetical protein
MSNLTWKIINKKTLRRLCKYIIVIFEYYYQRTFPLELSKIPKFNLTAENFPKSTHQDKEWSIHQGREHILSTAAWIRPYNHIHLQSFELRNLVHYRTGFIT